MKEKILEVKILGDNLVFYNNGEISTTDIIAKKIKENYGTVIDKDNNIVANLNGWGIFYLLSLIDPDFKILNQNSSFNVEDINEIKNYVREYLRREASTKKISTHEEKKNDRDSDVLKKPSSTNRTTKDEIISQYIDDEINELFQDSLFETGNINMDDILMEDVNTMFTERSIDEENVSYEDLSEYFHDDPFNSARNSTVDTFKKESKVKNEVQEENKYHTNNRLNLIDKLTELHNKIDTKNIRAKNNFIIEPFLNEVLKWPTNDPLYISTGVAQVNDEIDYLLGYPDSNVTDANLFLEEIGKNGIKLVVKTTDRIDNKDNKEALFQYFNSLKQFKYEAQIAILTDGFNWEVYSYYGDENNELNPSPLMRFTLNQLTEPETTTKLELLEFRNTKPEILKEEIINKANEENINIAIRELFVEDQTEVLELIISKIKEKDSNDDTLVSLLDTPDKLSKVINDLNRNGIIGLLQELT